MLDYTFPMDGEYEIQIRLMRDRDEHVEGLTEPHDLELLLDKARVQVFTVKPPQREPEHATVDQHLKIRVPVQAGPHALGVAFLKKPSLLAGDRAAALSGALQLLPPSAHPAGDLLDLDRRTVRAAGRATRPAGAGSSAPPGRLRAGRRMRRRTIARRDRSSALMKRAYRRPVTEADLRGPLALFEKGRAAGGFDAGIEMALSARAREPATSSSASSPIRPACAPKTAVSRQRSRAGVAALLLSLEQHSGRRAADVAIAGRLHEPPVLERQVRRMLADARSQALVNNFAAQWLHLRNLASITPDMRLFPDFDDNLRQAFRQETELFVDSMLREDRSVLDLLRADYTFVNERLAKHYGIPHVYGSHFRRIALDKDSERGGLLRQGSILTVTSYATRTSPVVRGKWILDNLLGVPPPPPLPDVPALKDNTVDGSLTVRKRLAEHRSNAVCAACHNLMDPIGLSLEKFDAVGRRRTRRGRRADRRVGRLPRRQHVRRCRRARSGAAAPAGAVRRRLDREAADLRVGARRRVLRCAGGPHDRARRARQATTASPRSSSESSRASRFR